MAKQDSAASCQPAYLPVQARVLRLYDDMAEFQDQCSFLCDSFTAVVTHEDVVCIETARGMGIYAERIKDQIRELKKELNAIHSEMSLLTSTAKGEG